MHTNIYLQRTQAGGKFEMTLKYYLPCNQTHGQNDTILSCIELTQECLE